MVRMRSIRKLICWLSDMQLCMAEHSFHLCVNLIMLLPWDCSRLRCPAVKPG